jgi:hypothetical protein
MKSRAMTCSLESWTSCEAAAVVKPKVSLRALGYQQTKFWGSRGAATKFGVRRLVAAFAGPRAGSPRGVPIALTSRRTPYDSAA